VPPGIILIRLFIFSREHIGHPGLLKLRNRIIDQLSAKIQVYVTTSEQIQRQDCEDFAVFDRLICSVTHDNHNLTISRDGQLGQTVDAYISRFERLIRPENSRRIRTEVECDSYFNDCLQIPTLRPQAQ
jgi:hypothetical protein